MVIAQTVGADLFEIVPATQFPKSYHDTVFSGYPIWAVDLPRLLVPFLRQQNFSGKTIAPFCTSAMSGLAGTEQRLRQLCLRALLLPGLSLPGGERGHNTLVTSLDADSRCRSEEWGQQRLTQ